MNLESCFRRCCKGEVETINSQSAETTSVISYSRCCSVLVLEMAWMRWRISFSFSWQSERLCDFVEGGKK